MGEKRKDKQVMEMRKEGKMITGSPRIKWEDIIEWIGKKRGKTITV